MTVQAMHSLLASLLGGYPEKVVASPSVQQWKEVVNQALTQGVAFCLQELSMLPADLQQRVHKECLNLVAKNLTLAAELRTILRAFRDHGIRCVPMRGLALAERLYNSVPSRPIGDIDLLVRREEIPRVQVLFQELGFSEMDRCQGFASHFSYTLKFFVERSFMVIVEPHWTIAYPPFSERLEMEAVWSRCVPARVVGEETLSLGREDLLVHLCLHLNHRDDAPLLWVYELDRYLHQESEAIRWDLVLSVSREVGIERLVGCALSEAIAKFGSPVPNDVLDALNRPNQCLTRPLAERLMETSDVDGVESLSQFFALNGLGAKFRYARSLLFPQPGFMMLQYGLTHRCQLPVSYIHRFCWFSWQAAKGLVQLCLGVAH